MTDVEQFLISPHLLCIEIWDFSTWHIFSTDISLISLTNIRCARTWHHVNLSALQEREQRDLPRRSPSGPPLCGLHRHSLPAPGSHNIAHGLVMRRYAFSIWWFHVEAHRHPSGHFNMPSQWHSFMSCGLALHNWYQMNSYQTERHGMGSLILT